MTKRTHILAVAAAALWLGGFTSTVAAETRIGYVVGVTDCIESQSESSCGGIGFYGLSLEQTLSDRWSIQADHSFGTLVFAYSLRSTAAHLKYIRPIDTGALYIKAGAHSYEVNRAGWLSGDRTRNGTGASVGIGWQYYRPSGLGMDIGLIGKGMTDFDSVGVQLSLSYGFNLF
ncbi:MAG: hypothetical protein JJU10_06250 [Idiomarina sp.]|nr:hypothetical protein [Idiomarina sp.]